MMELPEILSRRVDGESARFHMRIPPGLTYFEGHFSGEPIVPGVVQVGWAIHFGCEVFAVSVAADGLGKIKFNHIMGPDDELELQLNLDRKKGRLVYIYFRDEERMSSGEVRLREMA